MILQGDCVVEMAKLPAESIDSVICDPPYDLTAGKKGGTGAASVNLDSPYGRARIGTGNGSGGFMGKAWDSTGVAFDPATWREALRVLKPGGYLLAFGGTRTFHRLTCAVEDAGFEIRDCLSWMYGCLDIETEILVEGRWERWDTARTGQRALCYNVDSDEFTWQSIERVVAFPYSDTAYRLVGDHTDQLVTRDHRCLVEQGGAFVFERAEDAARKRVARVPVLENLQGLLDALPLPDEGTGGSQPHLLAGLRGGGATGTSRTQADARAAGHDRTDLPVRNEVLASASVDHEDSDAALLAGVQRDGPRQGMGEARPQGVGGSHAGGPSLGDCQDDRGEQSGMEGRRHDLQDARQLCRRSLRSLLSRVRGDGSQRRLRDGASAVGCTGDWPVSDADRDGAPLRPRPDAQRPDQPGALSGKSGSQAVRASRFTTTDLVTLEPVRYDGTAWCITIPGGAFVARRHGKVFVTGNSGFPKSLDVSKAIDKAAGAKRPVGRTGGKGPFGDTGRCPDCGRQYFSGNPCACVRADAVAATPDAATWQGWGTALKPAWEPIIMARKPLVGTVAANVLKHGTGAINVDGCRIEGAKTPAPLARGTSRPAFTSTRHLGGDDSAGRWPANVVFSHTPECREAGTRKVKGAKGVRGERKGFVYYRMRGTGEAVGYTDADGTETVTAWDCPPDCPVRMLDEQSGASVSRIGKPRGAQAGDGWGMTMTGAEYGDTGGASRFFFTAKASSSERSEGLGQRNSHPTVKPVALMSWLVRMVTPPGGTVLDPFLGSGSTAVAAAGCGYNWIGIELDPEYIAIAEQRLGLFGLTA